MNRLATLDLKSSLHNHSELSLQTIVKILTTYFARGMLISVHMDKSVLFQIFCINYA